MNAEEIEKADTCPNNHRSLGCASSFLLIRQNQLLSLYLVSFLPHLRVLLDFIWGVLYAVKHVFIKMHLCFQVDWGTQQ